MTKTKDPERWKKSVKLQRFIVKFSEHGNCTQACEFVGISRVAIWSRRQSDPAFEQAYLAAEACGTQALKDEAHRRAYRGVLKSVYHKGEIVGLQREYSDTLLMFMIKKHDPSFRDSFQVEHANAGGRPFMFQMMLHPEAVKQGKP